ncbi:hypothetical protein Tco_0425844 [Tanacetum coccineum]
MEAHCVNLELKYQNQALKEGQHGQFLKVTSNEAKVKHDIDVIETINIELEHKVAKLLEENETLKRHYKEMFDSIKTIRAKNIEHTTSLIANNDKFKAQLQEKGFAIAALKNELRKLTGNRSEKSAVAKPHHIYSPAHLGTSVSILKGRTPSVWMLKRLITEKPWLSSDDSTTKSKDNDKGSRSKITKHEGTSLQRRQRQRSQELNDKSNLIDLMKECHNELTSGEIVSLKILSRTMEVHLVTKLFDRIRVLVNDLKTTKQTYSSAFTKLILRVKKLEAQIKIGKARRRARIVHSDDEDIADDSSKQGRILSDAEVQEKASNETEPVIQDVTPTEVIQDQESSEKGSAEVSTAGAKQGTASEEVPIVSTAEVNLSTAGGTVTYTRRSAEKRSRQNKAKAIMIESEPKKKSVEELEQERLSFAEAIRLEEQMNEEQRAQIARDEEIARQWDEEERQRAMSEAKISKKIDWNDPSVIRYHTLKMKPKTVAQARRNMIKYLKNQGNYKISDFKGMSYNEIRPIFEKVWDFNQQFEPMDMEHGSEKMKSPEKIEEKDADTQKEVKEVVKESREKRKKSIPRKSTRKRQKMEEAAEKEELKGFLDIIPREEVPIEVASLSTKFPIVDWKTCVLTENFMYYQIFRGDGSSKNYKVLKGYDLMLWGDLHTLFEPDEEDKLWKSQHEYKLLSWRLYDFCGIHILLMENGLAIHMLTEKKYPLSQEMISKMLKKKLEVDHESSQAIELLRFIRSQVQK